jgi:hypothetical protein
VYLVFSSKNFKFKASLLMINRVLWKLLYLVLWLSDRKKDKLGRGRAHPIQELTPPHGHSISLILGPPITTTFKLGQNPINLKPTISLQILKLHDKPTIDPSATAKLHVGIDT